MSDYCTSCGSPVPEGQGSCSMCYGDPGYGSDGYYQEWLDEQARQEQARQGIKQTLEECLERRTTMIARQHDLFGGSAVIRQGTDADRVKHILDSDEGCRNNQNETIFVYWLTHQLDIIQEFVEPDKHDAMVRAARKLKPAKTVINRQQDLQRLHDHLAPSPDVAEQRQRQATQGRVR